MDLARLFASPLGPLILTPAFDALAVHLLVHYYFPASRLWAMALADESAATLLGAAEALAGRRRRVIGAVARAQALKSAYLDAHDHWQALFFGDRAGAPSELATVECARVTAAQHLMSARAAFMPLVRKAGLTPFAWRIPSPGEMNARHGARLAAPATAFTPDTSAPFELSQAVPGRGHETLWLRTPSEVAGAPDVLWARVDRPTGRARAALVFAHGIAMENEFWQCTSGLTELARAGIVVVQPEGPWHGRRRPEGVFGGEPVLASSPMGLLDYFDAHVRELGRLVHWARAAANGGPVAVGGVSLGALTAQTAAIAASHWPAACRPDAVFLVTTAGSLMDVTMDGSLTGRLGLPLRLFEGGWDRAALERWEPLLQPGDVPCVAPGNIVAVLGSRDTILPFGSGDALLARWGVPPENRFVRQLGHFTTSLGLYRHASPLERLRAILLR